MSCKVFHYCLILLLLGTTTASAETMYVKKNKTKMTAEKSPMSERITVFSKGVQVTVLRKEGRNFLVRAEDGKEGWVFKFRLTKKKPAKSGTGAGGLLAGLTGESSISAKESSSEGSIRGLKKVSKEYAQAKKISPEHVKAVERMEQFSVKERELLEFKQSGGIGEFSN